MVLKITGAKPPPPLKIELARKSIENSRGVVVFVVNLKRLGVVGQPGRVLDVKDAMTKPLKPNDVMDVLPDHAGDRHRAHEAHDHDALRFHPKITTKNTENTKIYRTIRLIPFCNFITLKLISRPTLTLAKRI